MFSFRVLFEASYKGNIGIIELNRFFSRAKKEDPELHDKVWDLINNKKDKEVWKIIQDYLQVKLVDK